MTASVFNPAVTCVEDFLRDAGKSTRFVPLPLVHPCVNADVGCAGRAQYAGGRCLDCREQREAFVSQNARRTP